MNLIEKYLVEAKYQVPDKSFNKQKQRERESYMNFHKKGSSFSKRVDALEANQPKWTKLEGQDILQVPGSRYAALPNTGKKSSPNFIVFDVKTRKEITYLKKNEVYGWLAKKAVDEKGL